MKNPRYANPQGGILLDYDAPGNPSIYVDQGPLYQRALNGDFGPIAPFVPPPPPDPSSLLAAARAAAALSRRDFFMSLESLGLYGPVMALSNNPSLPPAAKIDLLHSDKFYRNSSVVLTITSSLGLTPAQVDQIFGVKV